MIRSAGRLTPRGCATSELMTRDAPRGREQGHRRPLEEPRLRRRGVGPLTRVVAGRERRQPAPLLFRGLLEVALAADVGGDHCDRVEIERDRGDATPTTDRAGKRDREVDDLADLFLEGGVVGGEEFAVVAHVRQLAQARADDVAHHGRPAVAHELVGVDDQVVDGLVAVADRAQHRPPVAEPVDRRLEPLRPVRPSGLLQSHDMPSAFRVIRVRCELLGRRTHERRVAWSRDEVRSATPAVPCGTRREGPQRARRPVKTRPPATDHS